MQTITSKQESFEGGRYARTEEELYEKAIALLDKCKIEDLHSGGVPAMASFEPISGSYRG